MQFSDSGSPVSTLRSTPSSSLTLNDDEDEHTLVGWGKISPSNVSTLRSTPSLSLSLSDDEDEHALFGWGQISPSNPYFLPSLPSEVIPRRDDSWIIEEKEPKARRTPAPSLQKKPASKKPVLPSVIQNILPPSPSAAELSPGTDFQRLVARMQESRMADNGSPPHPGLTLSSPAQPIYQPQPRHVIDRKAISNLEARAARTEEDPVKGRMPQPSARVYAPLPKRKEKPFRGGVLPIRPPLPRWDQHDPVTSTQGSNRV
ncbi:hypothetical protein H0H87_002922 [Tephrocybe sp. NHM501043]|nr:hypothetical protein H0H87_002922 [Tephrocybe sp. NHM501043]